MIYELLPERTLAQEVDQKRLPPKDCIDILKQIILLLHKLHEEGVFIKKLSPDNIYVKHGKYKIKNLNLHSNEFELDDPFVSPDFKKSRQLATEP